MSHTVRQVRQFSKATTRLHPSLPTRRYSYSLGHNGMAPRSKQSGNLLEAVVTIKPAYFPVHLLKPTEVVLHESVTVLTHKPKPMPLYFKELPTSSSLAGVASGLNHYLMPLILQTLSTL